MLASVLRAHSVVHVKHFNGKIHWVQIDIDAAAKDLDHKIGAEERFMVAMARQ